MFEYINSWGKQNKEEDQDDNEADDGSGSVSQPDVTFVPQKETQALFGNSNVSSQGKFAIHILDHPDL